MPKIQIDIIDTMGNITTLPLPNDKPMDTIISSIVTLADLSRTNARGQAINYRLFSRRMLRVLSAEGTLFTNGVLDGDQLRIAPAPSDTYIEFEMLTAPDTGSILTIQARPRITIGRGSDNDIVIRDAIVSRQHGELLWQDGVHIYRDLNSANGSYINNKPVTEPTPLSVDSVLSLGEAIRILYRETVAAGEKKKSGTGPLTTTKADTGMRTSLTPLPRAGLYVSSAQEDKEVVAPIVDQLRRVNFHVFWEDEIPSGSNIEEAIESALKFSDVMVAIITKNSVITQRLLDQWHKFLVTNKSVVLVQYDNAEVPSTLQDYSIVPYRGSITRLIQELVAVLVETLR